MNATEYGIELYGGIKVDELLPSNWQRGLKEAIRDSARVVILHLDHPTSREDDFKGREFPTVVAPGNSLIERLPWLEEFYNGTLLEIVRSTLSRDVITLKDSAAALTGNVLGRKMRFESHVDHWPIGANLYAQWPKEHLGGGLKVSADKNARTYNEIMAAKGIVVHPIEGTVSIIMGQQHPHTVEAIRQPLREWQSGENTGYLEHVLTKGCFVIPSQSHLDSDSFWDNARISLNFNFDTPEQAISRTSTRGIYDYIHGENSK